MTQWLSDVEDGVILPHRIRLSTPETAKLRLAFDATSGTLHARGKPDAWGADAIRYRACDSMELCAEGRVWSPTSYLSFSDIGIMKIDLL